MGLLTKPARQPATGPAGRRRAKSGSARALDKGRHACGSSVKQGPVTKAGPVPVLHSSTVSVPQIGGIPVTNMREALAGGARSAGMEFECLRSGRQPGRGDG